MSLAKKVAAGILATTAAAATPGVSEAATTIFAYMKDGSCHSTIIHLNRGKDFSTQVGTLKVGQGISSMQGKGSWQDGFKAVGKVAAAFYLEGKKHGVIATRGEMKGCSGSWSPYCGGAGVTHKNGSIPTTPDNQCKSYWTTKGMFEAIQKSGGVTGKVRTEFEDVAPRREKTTPVRAETRTTSNDSKAVVTHGTVVTRGHKTDTYKTTCSVDQKGCINLQLRFD